MAKYKSLKACLSILLIGVFFLAMINVQGIIKASETGEATLLHRLEFDGKDATSPTGNYQVVPSVDGSNAVRLQNTKGGAATQYIDLGTFDMAQKSISVAMWVKVATNQILVNNYCALISNKNWASQTNAGFMIATSYSDSTFKGGWVDFSTASNSTAYYRRNLPNFDGEWHNIVVTIDRADSIKYYADGILIESMPISALSGKSATAGNLFVGCDSTKKYGVIDTTFDNIEVYEGVMTAEQIAKNSNPILLSQELSKASAVYEQVLSQGKLTKANKKLYKDCVAEAKAGASTYVGYAALIEKVRAVSLTLLEEEELPKLSFNVVSDIHIDGATASASNDVAIYEKKMQTVFTNLGQMFPKTDAVMIPGDYTRNGKNIDFEKFDTFLDKYNTVEKLILSLGNHEMRGLSNFSDIASYFKNTVKSYGVETDNVYYDQWINGFHFISLSSESNSEKTKAVLSAKQLAWFEDKLAENAKANQPIFVSLHQPLSGTFPTSSLYPVGDQEPELKEILKKYPQTVLISGHLHNGYVDDNAFIRSEYGYLVDAPAIKQNDLANQGGNLVYRFESYVDKTIIKVIDFERQIELYEYRKTILHSQLAPGSSQSDLEEVTATNKAGQAIEEVTDGNKDTARNVSSLDFTDHEIIINLGGRKSVSGIRYLAGTATGRITNYVLEYSYDGINYLGFSNSSGIWTNDPDYQVATFEKITANYIKLRPLSSIGHTATEFITSVAELAVIYSTNNIISTVQSSIQTVDKGTDFESLALPQTVKVKLENGLTVMAKVVWQKGSYDKDKLGIYQLSGTIQPDRYTTNSNGMTALIRIRVK